MAAVAWQVRESSVMVIPGTRIVPVLSPTFRDFGDKVLVLGISIGSFLQVVLGKKEGR